MREDGKLDYLEMPEAATCPRSRPSTPRRSAGASSTTAPTTPPSSEGLDGGFHADSGGRRGPPRPCRCSTRKDLDAMLAKVTGGGRGHPAPDLRLPRRSPLPFPRPGRQRTGGLDRGRSLKPVIWPKTWPKIWPKTWNEADAIRDFDRPLAHAGPVEARLGKQAVCLIGMPCGHGRHDQRHHRLERVVDGSPSRTPTRRRRSRRC